jgi:hypothetical protein
MKAKKSKRRRRSGRGCPCLSCGAPTRVVYAEPEPAGTFRLRECPFCGRRIRTHELAEETISASADYAGVIRSEKLLAKVAKVTAPSGAAGIFHIQEMRNDQ